MKSHLYHDNISTEKIVELYVERKLSIDATARELGINPKTVMVRLANAGIPLRSKSESAAFRPNRKRGPYIDPIKNFWSKVNKNGPVPKHCPELGPCWVWTSSKRGEYGSFSYIKSSGERVYMSCHRISYEWKYGQLPKDKPVVCHRCDNRACVRPSHLFAGTTKDNAADAMRKGRTLAGERNPKAVLTQKDAREIRRLYATGKFAQQAIADRFGINQATVSEIIRNKTYKEAA